MHTTGNANVPTNKDMPPTIDDNSLSELLKYKERFTIALKGSRICVFEVDLTRQLYTFFENAEDIFGVSDESILRDVQPYSKLSPEEYQRCVSEYFSHPDDSHTIDKAFKSIFKGNPTSYQARMKAGNSRYIWCKIDVTPIMENNAPIRMIGIITDIDDLRARAESFQKMAELDRFTGLYNKNHSERLIKSVLRKESKHHHMLILFDLDNFKTINDTYGHAAGDSVLQSIAENLKESFRKTDIIGRFGGDEFIILIKDVENCHELSSRIDALSGSNDNDYHVTKSVGISLFPDDGRTFSELFEKADKALYYAKRSKNTRAFYSEIS